MKKYQGRERTRNLVRIRDNFTCQDCGLKRTEKDILSGKYKRSLDVHHLNGLCGKKSRAYDSVKDIPILITLCHKCHFNRPEHRCKSGNFGNFVVDKKKYENIKKMRMSRYTLQEIGNKYGVTRERIRQILLKL